MELTNEIKATGKLEIVVRDEAGIIKEIIQAKNLVVTVGKNYLASRAVGTATTVNSHMAIGTGTGTPGIADTTLGTEAGRVTLASYTASGAVITATATFPAGTGTGAITEAGIFNSVTPGTANTLFCRTTFPVVNKAAGDSIAVTWQVTIS